MRLPSTCHDRIFAPPPSVREPRALPRHSSPGEVEGAHSWREPEPARSAGSQQDENCEAQCPQGACQSRQSERGTARNHELSVRSTRGVPRIGFRPLADELYARILPTVNLACFTKKIEMLYQHRDAQAQGSFAALKPQRLCAPAVNEIEMFTPPRDRRRRGTQMRSKALPD